MLGKQKITYWTTLSFLLVMLVQPVFGAIPCNTPAPNNPIFNDGLQTNSPTGKVSFNCGSQLLNSPDNLIETSCLGPESAGCTPPSCSPATCGSANCARNTSVSMVGTMTATFPSFSGGSNVTNPSNLAPGTYNTVTLSSGNPSFSCNGCNNTGTNYRITTLNVSTGVSNIRLAPGNYYIKNFNINGNGSTNRTFVVSGTGDGSGTVRLFINNGSTPIDFSKKISINPNGTNDQFIIFAYQGASFTNKDSTFKALVYSPLDILFQPDQNGNIAFSGAVTARNITVGQASNKTAQITYSNRLPTLAGFGPITCNAAIGANPTQFSITGLSNPSANCSTLNVTVTALNSDGSTNTGYTGTVVLSTQGSCTVGSGCTGVCTSGGTTCKGTWNTAGGCIGCGNSNGYATYTFQASDNGVRSFTLVYPPEGLSPTNVVVYDSSSAGINGSSGSIAFNPTQFILVESSTAVGTPPAPASYSTPQVAGSSFTPQVKLVAYAGCGSGVASSYTGNKSIRLYSTYVNPTPINAGGTAVRVNGSAIAASSSAASTSQTLNFVNGVATLTTVAYSDVGSITLTALDNTLPSMIGNSGNIVVKPFNFLISGTNIPGTSDPNGPLFAKAGQPFAATVTVVGLDGNIARSFGKETSSQGILLQSASVAAPSGGRNGSDNLGTIGNATGFTSPTPGVFQGTTFTYDEVGSINLRARLANGNYLGAGDVVGTSVLVGRFQPDHFDATGNTPQFSTGCNSGQFTYLDQPFIYATAPVLTVTAKAANNSISTNYTTQNYNGSFKKLSASQFSASVQDYQPGAASTPNIDKSAANLPLPTETDSGAGTMTYTFAGSGGGANQGLRLNRSAAGATPTSPFTANIQLRLTIADTDTTPVVYSGNPFVFNGSGSGIAFNNGASFYHGRLLVQNAYGSEIAPLQVPMNVQYYNASQFVNNTVDSCTQISSSTSILLTDPVAPQTGVSTTASLPQPGFMNGASYILLSAPNASGQKNIEVNLDAAGANLPWLKFDWPFLMSTAYENPQAQANFGVYQGEPRIIYQQENYR